MTTYSFPSVTPNASTLVYVSNTKAFQSPLSGSVQTASRSGSRWQLRMEFRNLTAANRRTMQAFLVKLDGMTHRFTVHDHTKAFSGVAAGTPLVNGASQSGQSIITDGWTSGDQVNAGDMFGLDGELKMCVTDASESGGAMTIEFRPEIHTSPANNSAIVTSNPTGIFMLTSLENGWSNSPYDSTDAFSDFTIEAIEDVNA